MSMMKTYIENEIDGLAEETGYEADFLRDIWNEEVINGDADFEYFRAVTMERDW